MQVFENFSTPFGKTPDEALLSFKLIVDGATYPSNLRLFGVVTLARSALSLACPLPLAVARGTVVTGSPACAALLAALPLWLAVFEGGDTAAQLMHAHGGTVFERQAAVQLQQAECRLIAACTHAGSRSGRARLRVNRMTGALARQAAQAGVALRAQRVGLEVSVATALS